MVEINWFRVLDDGDGRGNFGDQLGGAVPGAVEFEGGDLFNLGATHASDNPDFVSAAIGFRSRLADSVTAGFAYEIPLTDEEDSLMEERFTVDLTWTLPLTRLLKRWLGGKWLPGLPKEALLLLSG